MTPVNDIVFARMSGAQNTFFIVDALSGKPDLNGWSQSDRQNLAQKICTSYFGFATDGLIVLEKKSGYDFAWDFYNSDGSVAEMCGNAARCVSLFYHDRIMAKNEIHFLTGAGDIFGQIVGKNQVRVSMTEVFGLERKTVLGFQGLYVNTGVPHFVISEDPNAALAKRLREVSDFGAAGANITFVKIKNANSIEAVTFERGVENFTRACGTGAVAASVYLQITSGAQEHVSVLMPGGELVIEKAQEGQRPFLSGPARFDFDLVHLGENR
ncbi:MAG: diaminopimelate epimerase [Bdellovibrio sp. CG10_big_fil_rev_8_21_14_0_10_47_8]|nr:MAG: diaminopimelate epimerase [Bdellovibrio sp. CG10_big_fil_rev_8_21_14_0_10_47_8]